jgi:hypothetical protein
VLARGAVVGHVHRPRRPLRPRVGQPQRQRCLLAVPRPLGERRDFVVVFVVIAVVAAAVVAVVAAVSSDAATADDAAAAARGRALIARAPEVSFVVVAAARSVVRSLPSVSVSFSFSTCPSSRSFSRRSA